MGYKKMSFGCLKVGIPNYNIPVVMPQNPVFDSGDIFEFNSNYSLSFGTATSPAGQIAWIKPDNMPIFVADRVLLNMISYAHLIKIRCENPRSIDRGMIAGQMLLTHRN